MLSFNELRESVENDKPFKLVVIAERRMVKKTKKNKDKPKIEKPKPRFVRADKSYKKNEEGIVMCYMTHTELSEGDLRSLLSNVISGNITGFLVNSAKRTTALNTSSEASTFDGFKTFRRSNRGYGILNFDIDDQLFLSTLSSHLLLFLPFAFYLLRRHLLPKDFATFLQYQHIF